MSTTKTIHQHGQHGFTLLEVLVTVIVISIGLLGLLGLQSEALVSTQISRARSQATLAADSMADRIRANPAGSAVNAYDRDDGNGAGSGQSTPADCTASSCTPTQMAAFDFAEWQQRLDQSLPGGSGTVACTSNDGTECIEYVITVTWQERNPDGTTIPNDDTNCGTSDGIINRCFQTVVRP
ncbi:type IV pilus modification protein PilV [Salinisphaera sp.]|uniref:type IV pilus modification protein PilV n=1 Tax=Salinisphaera sp. TaxID=1914330 RepID=UPI002D77FC1E|nr:type IV pilus modification protein PilV [Salinisphaera sp.]HET7314741.1 type IV pilus modification protein PilV [Salinisphaera sp.]